MPMLVRGVFNVSSVLVDSWNVTVGDEKQNPKPTGLNMLFATVQKVLYKLKHMAHSKQVTAESHGMNIHRKCGHLLVGVKR